MEITLYRNIYTKDSTIGSLYIDGAFLCYTLEDRVRAYKIKHETAIPAGRYRIELTWSPKYKRVCPQVMDVPNFSGIRIHAGNTKKDTSGCILLGTFKKRNKIESSRVAVKAFEKIVIPYLENEDCGEVWINILETEEAEKWKN